MLLFVSLRKNSFILRTMGTNRPRTPLAVTNRVFSDKVGERDIADHALFGVFEALVFHSLDIEGSRQELVRILLILEQVELAYVEVDRLGQIVI